MLNQLSNLTAGIFASGGLSDAVVVLNAIAANNGEHGHV
jgi:hypothetical protein